MLEPVFREKLEAAGMDNITIQTDKRGIRADVTFRGTAPQLRNRLGGEITIEDTLETADQPTHARLRPAE